MTLNHKSNFNDLNCTNPSLFSSHHDFEVIYLILKSIVLMVEINVHNSTLFKYSIYKLILAYKYKYKLTEVYFYLFFFYWKTRIYRLGIFTTTLEITYWSLGPTQLIKYSL